MKERKSQSHLDVGSLNLASLQPGDLQCKAETQSYTLSTTINIQATLDFVVRQVIYEWKIATPVFV